MWFKYGRNASTFVRFCTTPPPSLYNFVFSKCFIRFIRQESHVGRSGNTTGDSMNPSLALFSVKWFVWTTQPTYVFLYTSRPTPTNKALTSVVENHFDWLGKGRNVASFPTRICHCNQVDGGLSGESPKETGPCPFGAASSLRSSINESQGVNNCVGVVRVRKHP